MEHIEEVSAEVLAALIGENRRARHSERVWGADSLLPQGFFPGEEPEDVGVDAQEGRTASRVPATKSHRFPASAVLPPPTPAFPPNAPSQQPCPICHGAGYVRENLPFGHPQFGKPQECRCRRERKQAEQSKELWRLSQFDEYATFRDATLKSFRVDIPGVLEAGRAAWHYAQRPDGWLILVGGNGCGKTHLAVAIARQCLSTGVPVLFAVVPDLLSVLRSTYARESQTTYDEAFVRYTQARVLVLDDLGAEQSTAWAEGQLFQLLNYRYHRRLPTVITTNRFQLSDRHFVKQIEMSEATDYRLRDEEEISSWISYSH